ncbi:uncharacterized protein [Diabrotica undecimpunctata]|uniref:uncharacterized protein n=1 Tax=Diabrotica undecimpunctata TaxID=50387 RepID=UPI003B632C83
MIAPSWDNEYTLYGKDKEDVARQRFIELNPEKRVQKCGIFIDNIYNHLAATPDGIVDDNSLLEVKCLLKVHKSGKSLLEAVETLKNMPLENKNGTLQLKKNHYYMYQIQGQLNIARKDYCYFVVYVNDTEPLFIEKIERDEELWARMIEKLNSFFYKCFLPKMVDRNKKCLNKNH